MSAFQQQYKAKPTKFIDTNGGRNIRSIQYENLRKKRRSDVINGKRSISNDSENVAQQDEPQPTASKPEARMLQLRLWKAERDKRKEMALLKKRRPFVTGVLHHRLNSPIPHYDKATGRNIQHQKIRQPVAPAVPLKRITKATEKRLLSKSSWQDKEQTNRKKQQSIAPNNYKFKPPEGLHKV